MSQNRYCLALDLKDDPGLIKEYEEHHRKVWPEILKSIREAGVNDMRIYRYRNRLFMVMEVDETFSFEKKAAADAANPKVQEWEALMWKYQQSIAGNPAGGKWVLMEELFSLNHQHTF